MKRVVILIAVIFLAIIIVPLHAGRAAQDRSAVFKRIAPAQAMVAATWPNGVVYASAFCISSGNSTSYYLTARHVVSDEKSAVQPTIKLARYSPAYEDFDATVQAVGDSGSQDLAVLKASSACSSIMMFDPVVKTGDAPIVAAGFPCSLIGLREQNHSIDGPAVADGNVASPIDNGDLLQINVGTVNHSSSGGPIYDPASGQVMGMVVSMYDPRQGQNADDRSGCSGDNGNVVYALPVPSAIIPFLKKNNIPFELPKPANGTDGRWVVSGEFSSAAGFGHYPPYCNYTVDMTIRELTIDIENSNVTAGRLQTHQKETLDGPFPQCDKLTPIPPNDQLFDFVSGTVSGKNVDFVFRGKAGNPALSNAAFHGRFSDASHLDGTLTFVRLDEGPPFDWRIPLQISLRPKTD